MNELTVTTNERIRKFDFLVSVMCQNLKEFVKTNPDLDDEDFWWFAEYFTLSIIRNFDDGIMIIKAIEENGPKKKP